VCGRFTLHTERDVLVRRFRIDPEGVEGLEARYNVAPSTDILTVRSGPEGRQASWMRWGLVPFWAKDRSKLPSMINARAETVATRSSYRMPFRRQRCLILADGFYEWGPNDLPRGKRTPFWISLQSGEPFAMAGLWSQWRPPEEPDAEPELSCTILTMAANAIVGRVHDRMPVILQPDSEEAWLDPEVREVSTLQKLLVPVAPESLQTVPVSRRVNSPKNDGPELIHAVPEPPTLGF
jgi:putative SOS response-associated peptidase YedK